MPRASCLDEKGQLALIRIAFIPHLARVNPAGQFVRRIATRTEIPPEARPLVDRLAEARLLIKDRRMVGGEDIDVIEVAHEALLREWKGLNDALIEEREFLIAKGQLEQDVSEYKKTPESQKEGALLAGNKLTRAREWLTKRPQDLTADERKFIVQSRRMALQRRMRVQALIGALAGVIVLGFAAYWYEQSLWNFYHWAAHVRGHVLTAQDERMLKPLASFTECVKTDGSYSKYCPEMVVMPAGKFMMGSPKNEKGRWEDEGDDEGRQHEVAIAQPFAVSQFELTFDQWDACIQYGGCRRIGSPFGGGKQPAVMVTWYDAQKYVNWLSTLTGRQYRLLSEAEWEYAARARTTSPYSFEGEESSLDEYAWYANNSENRTHPVGGKKPNDFGLYDMHGNVWEWVEDCYNKKYDGSPVDGAAWTKGACERRVIRGGAWDSIPRTVRSAVRGGQGPGKLVQMVGFRVGRTLFAGGGATTVAPGTR